MINRMVLRTLLAALAAVLLVPTAAADPPTRERCRADLTGQFCRGFRSTSR